MYAIFNVVTTRADADSALVVDDREDWLSDIGGEDGKIRVTYPADTVLG